jgi:capsule polysaccharide export protein KpsE/RkpR
MTYKNIVSLEINNTIMRVVILLVIIFFVSCKSPDKKVNKVTQLSSKSESNLIKGVFKEFWKNSGQALRINDTLALDKYMDSTVYLYGNEDEDPTFELKDIDRIIKVREIYLTSGTFIYPNETEISINYKDFFLNENALNRMYKDGQDEQHIEDFIFSRNKQGEWKLIAVYKDTKKLKKKLSK